MPLFAPVIRHFRESGVTVILTARDHSQTIELLKLHGFDGTFTVIGRHHGKGKAAKIAGLLSRSQQLAAHIKRSQRPAVALSHGSRPMVLAAWWLRIPVVTMYDYEFTETVIFNRFSDKVWVPDRISDTVLDEIGLAKGKRVKYPGIKEELYVSRFVSRPDFRESFLAEHGIADTAGKIIAILRPPATTANYHNEKSDFLLDAVLQYLISANGVFTIIVPRTTEQGRKIRESVRRIADSEGQVLILENAVNGLELTNMADLVISGGGTMNREAALLGVPVYSIFAGRQGALDRAMEADGSIVFIRDIRDLSKIRLERRDPTAGANRLTDRVERFVIEQLNSFLENS